MRSLCLWLREIRIHVRSAVLCAWWRALGVKVGRGLRAEGWPVLTLEPRTRLTVGEGVIFRAGVEIRVHEEAEVRIGSGCRIDRGVRLLATHRAVLSLGGGSRVGLGSVLNGGDDITVGAKSLLSGYVFLQTSAHRYEGLGQIQDQGYTHQPVRLGPDCWLGAHAVVLPGVELGAGVVVGALSVVTQSFPAGSVVVGAPARLVKQRSLQAPTVS